MQPVIEIALPFFALIFTGFAAGRTRLLAGGTVAGLSAFVFYFALPALLVVETYQAPSPSGRVTALLAAYYLPGLALFAIALMIGRRLFRLGTGAAALQALSAVFSNVGFIGLPLSIMLFGGEAALPAVLIVMGDSIVMLGIATALVEADLGRGQSSAVLVRVIAGGVARNPIIVASVIGVSLNVLDAPVPAPLLNYGGLLADAAGPCALFALGATLAGRPMREGIAETAYLSLMKLVVHPTLVAAAAFLVFDLPPLWAAVLVIQAALPIAANVYVLAQRYDLHTGRISTAILASTGLAVVTITLLLPRIYP